MKHQLLSSIFLDQGIIKSFGEKIQIEQSANIWNKNYDDQFLFLFSWKYILKTAFYTFWLMFQKRLTGFMAND